MLTRRPSAVLSCHWSPAGSSSPRLPASGPCRCPAVRRSTDRGEGTNARRRRSEATGARRRPRGRCRIAGRGDGAHSPRRAPPTTRRSRRAGRRAGHGRRGALGGRPLRAPGRYRRERVPSRGAGGLRRGAHSADETGRVPTLVVVVAAAPIPRQSTRNDSDGKRSEHVHIDGRPTTNIVSRQWFTLQTVPETRSYRGPGNIHNSPLD